MPIKSNWWKYLGVALVLYSIVGGFLVRIPDLPRIHESIRNLFFHVVMWFTMMVVFIIALVNSIRFLSSFNFRYDIIAAQAVHTGIFFGIIGIVTGMEWASSAWGTPWTNDPQLNGAAITLLSYFAYMVLRRSIDEDHKRARIAAVYNIFAFAMLVVFIGILPRLAQGSLHPGAGGSASTVATLDNKLRMVFYPAIIGWILIAAWIVQLRVRSFTLKHQLDNPE